MMMLKGKKGCGILKDKLEGVRILKPLYIVFMSISSLVIYTT